MRSKSFYRLTTVFAIVAVIAVVGLLSTLFWPGVNLSTTMFSIVSAIGTIVSITLGVAGYYRQATQKPDDPLPAASRDSNAPLPAPLTKEESYTQYLANLQTRVTDGIGTARRYVPLDAQAEIENASDDEIEPLQEFSVQEQTKMTPISLLSAHKRFRRYVLLGDPGSGKTTTLNILALRQIQLVRKGANGTLLPFFCSLARWTDRRQTAIAFLKERFAELAGPGSTLDFEQLLSGGKLLVMLDGLNEMPFRRPRWSPTQATDMIDPNKVQLNIGEDNRERLLNDVATSQGVNSRFIVTCRTYEFAATPQWQQVFVQPMSDEQIRLFVNKYAPARADALWKVIDGNDALRKMARNPFYLRNITQLEHTDFSSVRNRATFFVRLIHELFERERERGEKFEDAQILEPLGRAAFAMLRANSIGSTVPLTGVASLTDRVRTIGVGTGLLSAGHDGEVRFYHQLVQEFLAAMALHHRYVRRWSSLMIRDEKWLQVLLLKHELIEEQGGDLPRFVSMLKSRNGLYPERFLPPIFAASGFFAILVYGIVVTNLTVDLIFNGGRVSWLFGHHPTAFLAVLVGLPFCLVYVLPVFAYNRGAIGNAAFLLGEIRNPATLLPLIESFSRMGMSWMKIAQALTRYGSTAIPLLRSQLRHRNAAVRRGCVEALGMLRAEEAIPDLERIIRSGNPALMGSVSTALARINTPESRHLIMDAVNVAAVRTHFTSFFYFAQPAALTTMETRDVEFVERLAKFLVPTYPLPIQQWIISALGATGDENALPHLLAPAKEVGPLAVGALRAIAAIRSPRVPGILTEIAAYRAYRNEEAPVIAALKNVRSPEAFPGLVELTSNSNSNVRSAVVHALGNMHVKEAVDELSKFADDADEGVRKELADSLARLAPPDGDRVLVRLLDDSDEEVRKHALEALDYVYPDIALPHFLSHALDGAYPERLKIIEMLAAYKDEQVANALVKLAGDPDDRIRQAAIDSLKQVSEKLEKSLRFVRGRRFAFLIAIFRSVYRRSGFEAYGRLIRECRLQTATEQEAWIKANETIFATPELKRQMGRVFVLFLWAFMSFACFVGILVTLVLRGLIGLGGIYIAHWYWTVGLVAAALLLFVLKGRYDFIIPVVGTLLTVNLFFAAVATLMYFLFSRVWVLLSLLLLLALALGIFLVLSFRGSRVSTAIKEPARTS